MSDSYFGKYDELEAMKLPVYFEIKGFDAKTKGLEYNLECIGKISAKECDDAKEKAKKVIGKHFNAWLKKHHIE